jgi:hypothetical protein
MNAMSDLGEAGGDGALTLSVGETHWGYIIRERDAGGDRRLLRDAALVFAGVVLLAVGLGQWLMPGALLAADLIAIKVAITAAMLGVGLACLHAVGREARVEVQVDTVRRELRVTERDRRGTERLLQRVPMREIDSAYVKRGARSQAGGHLLLRLAESDAPLHLATGSERELRLLHDRLRSDLRPARERVERRLLREATRAMAPAADTRAASV